MKKVKLNLENLRCAAKTGARQARDERLANFEKSEFASRFFYLSISVKITTPQLKAQIDRARRYGWIEFFEQAAVTRTFGFFDTADLLAIASRESNLDPKWLAKAGDGGNGYGLLQADLHSFPDWIETGKWKDAKEGIFKGAEVLMLKWSDMHSSFDNKRSVKSSKTGKISYFILNKVEGTTAQKICISSYNCGRWALYAAANGQDVDTYSTGKDYAADVMARAAVIRKILNSSVSPAPVAGLAVPGNPSPTRAENAVEPIAALGAKGSADDTDTDTGTEKTATATQETEKGQIKVESTQLNLQSVTDTAEIAEPKPQGFAAKLTAGIATLTGGTVLYDALGKVSGIAFTSQTIIIICFLIFISFLGFCVYMVLDAWKSAQRIKVQAEANTSIDKKDLVWKKPE